jgi:hypothetical protein
MTELVKTAFIVPHLDTATGGSDGNTTPVVAGKNFLTKGVLMSLEASGTRPVALDDWR